MFKHKAGAAATTASKEKSIAPADDAPVAAPVLPSVPVPDRPELRELLEKNLKWSQIIYEQNRKINRKMMWLAVAGWFRFVIIAAPIALALWYLPPFIEKFQTTISGFTGGANNIGKPTYSIEQLMQLLPLGEAEKAQLKTLLK